ncbi:CNH domain-containing protein [Schizophyllum commune]
MVGSPNAPGDADLQVLYDAVLKAYVEEPQESSSASINGEVRAASVSSINQSINGEQREPTASPSQSHASGRSRRPLPPTPGSSSSGPTPKPPIMNFDNGSKASHESAPLPYMNGRASPRSTLTRGPSATSNQSMLASSPLANTPSPSTLYDVPDEPSPSYTDSINAPPPPPAVVAAYNPMLDLAPGVSAETNDAYAQLVATPDSVPANLHTPTAAYTGVPDYAHDSQPIAGPSNIQRGNSTTSYGTQSQYQSDYAGPSSVPAPYRHPTVDLNDIPQFDGGVNEEELFEEDLEDEDDINMFVNLSLLSHLAMRLRDKVPRGTHVKGSIPYPRAFTGKDIVSAIQSSIQRELAINHGVSTSDRRIALQVARSLQNQLFFYEVEWGGRELQDGVEDVYMFLDDAEGPSSGGLERAELPTGVVTMLTKCYSPSCGEDTPCYCYSCPRKGAAFTGIVPESTTMSTASSEWPNTVAPEVLASLPDSEINRQTIIHKLISKEEQYVHDLDTIDRVFIRPLRNANPPVIPKHEVDEFIDDVFGNILDLRECNRRLLEVMYVRQREQAPVVQRIGDIFLDAATEFRLAYPIYAGHHPMAEKRLKEELEQNGAFRLWIEDRERQIGRDIDGPRLDLKHLLNRPVEHLQKYPVLLEAICRETADGNPDGEFLMESVKAIRKLQAVAQLRSFQLAMGRGVTGKWEWHDLVTTEYRKSLTKDEAKRQAIIFELIKGEMAYVRDLENIEHMYIRPLREADPPIIPPERLNQFIQDVFHNYSELLYHHRRLMEHMHEVQRDEHPRIRSITACVFDAVLNFREAYIEYIPNYPIAAYRIDDEMANNHNFKDFVEASIRHPESHRLDMKNFINRPIPRLLRYELLLKNILDETPPGHPDRNDIPQVLELIKALGKETEPGVMSAKQKVELWRYANNLVFKPGEAVDMDLKDDNRSLIHCGKLLRQPDSSIPGNNWTELFVLVFDNYMVMTRPKESKEKEGMTKYHVNRRPIPLDLMTLVNFTDPPTQRSTGLLRNLRGGGGTHAADPAVVPSAHRGSDATDSRSVFPFTIHYNGRLGGTLILYAESQQARQEWRQVLEEALGLRAVVQESNKVFEIETLSTDTFLVPSLISSASPAWNHEASLTGKVTCSVPFNTLDNRALVAIGCEEGVWIGYRHDSKSMRRVLHLKMVSQMAMLEDFGLFLVCADRSLFAYHIEALVPSSPHSSNASQTPQKLNGSREVSFFSVGMLHNRTLVVYVKRKGVNSSNFYILEPVIERINEKAKTAAPTNFGNLLGRKTQKMDWFRSYRDFSIPAEAYDLIFLKARIAILCSKGFEIMDIINDLSSVSIPARDDMRLANLTRRLDSCKPMGMFRCTDDEFLLCYDEFGIHVNKHGQPSRSTNSIEWEGTAERVAFHPPYILLFDTRFIEIRHVQTGLLAQVIPGNDMHCIWDGRGLNASHYPMPVDGTDNMVQEARVHGVMKAPEPPSSQGGFRSSRPVAQHVFELIPTIPLYLPGSLASPSTPVYYPQSFSPPRSPPLQPYRG